MAHQTFNFEDPGYVPGPPFIFSFSEEVEEACYAQWTDEDEQWERGPDLQWGECPDLFTYLKQIWTDNTYVYAATTDGLNIVQLESEQAYAHITYKGGFNSVYADDTYVYLATPSSGVKYFPKTCISGSTDDPYELITCLSDYLKEPDILSNQVRYIHGNNGHLIMSTASGVNYRGPDVYYQRAQHGTKLARKVFITPSGKIYYTTWDGSKWRVNIKNADNQDWDTPDKFYETGTFLINAGVDILDIFVTEGTSETGAANTIFIATTSGIFVIDEGVDEGDTYYTAQ